MACWIGARPPQQRGPLRSAPSADSPGDSRLLGGRAFWARELAAVPGAQRHQGLGQRPQRPNPGSRPVGKRQSQSPPARTPSLGRLALCRVSGKRREGRGHRGAPADAPPAASQAAPPRGDEALAVKMEVTCLLLLALIPFHCRGQGVYGKSRVQLHPGGAARKLCKILLKVRAGGPWWSPGLAFWSG